MNQVFNPEYLHLKDFIEASILNFDSNGKDLAIGKRNKIKIFEQDSFQINIKSFKKPPIFKSIIYKFFRKSKAKRSFENANFLIKKNIGTPKPIAYIEYHSFMGLKKSYYICEQHNCDLLFRDIVESDYKYPDTENILKQFAKFTYNIHEAGIEFKDHTPGNTLITKKENGQYAFALVDLNRMNFHNHIGFELRMKNLSRISALESAVKTISYEYAIHYKKDKNEVFNLLWKLTSKFQEKYWRKRKVKSKMGLE